MVKNDRVVEVKRLVGKKTVKGKTYEYEYYNLPLNLYIPKHMVAKHGTRFVLHYDLESGVITLTPAGGNDEQDRKVTKENDGGENE